MNKILKKNLILTLFIIQNLIFLINYSLNAKPIQSHQAVYQISLDKAKKKTKIIDIQGRSIYSLQSQCFGWETREDFLIIFVYEDGKTAKIENKFETFETYDGQSFQFSLSEKFNDNENENFFGFANIDGRNNLPEAVFFSNDEKKIKLSKSVNFPVNHLKKLISKAREKKTIFQSKIFLGSEIHTGEKVVTAIIGLSKEKNSKIQNKNLIEKKYWPINLAYFDPISNESEPEFEIFAKLQENGIMRGFDINYGEFSINARIDKLKEIPNIKCD